MCAKREGSEGLKITSTKLVATIVPSSAKAKPWGVCIQELAARIQNALIKVPIATVQVERKCKPGPTRFQPNSMMPRKDASKKNAVSTS